MPWDLDKELEKRLSNDIKFKEEELWYITRSVTDAASHLQERNILHGYI